MFYYIDNSCVEGQSAHALQIKNTVAHLEEKIDVFIISQDNKKYFKKHIIFPRPKFYSKMIPFSVFDIIKKIKKKIVFNKEDIIFTRSSYVALKLYSKVKKVILEVHDMGSMNDGLINYFFQYFSFIKPLRLLKNKKNIFYVTITKGLKEDMIKKGFDPKKITVIPDAVDPNLFDIKLTKKEARKELGIKQNQNIILYYGGFVNWKGYDTLLEASNYTDVKIIMIGASDSQLKELNKKYPKVKILLYSPQDLIVKYMKAADVLVIPNSGKFQISSKYTSPLKLFEYMMAKKPIIVSNLPSIHELLSDDDVLFFEPDNPKDLAKKIDYLIKNKKLQKKLSENAYKKSKKYTWDERAKKIIKFLKIINIINSYKNKIY